MDEVIERVRSPEELRVIPGVLFATVATQPKETTRISAVLARDIPLSHDLYSHVRRVKRVASQMQVLLFPVGAELAPNCAIVLSKSLWDEVGAIIEHLAPEADATPPPPPLKTAKMYILDDEFVTTHACNNTEMTTASDTASPASPAASTTAAEGRRARRFGLVSSELLSETTPVASVDVVLQEIPSEPPITQSEWEKWSIKWPTKRPALRDFEKPELFPAAETRRINANMRAVIELAKTVTDPDSRRDACIVVDPRTNDIVARATDTRGINPLAHATMNAIHEVALREQRMVDSGVEDISFLCTGFEAYLTTEPCIFCSMALVHSRISRVFFARPNPHDGGLGGVMQVHSQRAINHRYDAYLGPCTSLATCELAAEIHASSGSPGNSPTSSSVTATTTEQQ
eukprot:comp18519_c0_seq1/m.33253 comp18519_c0_seq1/g.33253  ORF comp18519_c0_seq1/g.33253 comp18519_c0_seq1/m.33253 type:complete len:402 (-) comp18519_c0_seq1:32-1237(-)